MNVDQRLHRAGAALRAQAANSPRPPLGDVTTRKVNDMAEHDTDETRGRRGAFWTIGAAAATVIVVIGLLVATRSGSDHGTELDQPDSTTPPTPSSPVPTTTPATTAPEVTCIELHQAPGQSSFVEVCDDEIPFDVGRPQALIEIDAIGDDCEQLQAVSTQWRADVRTARESWEGPIAPLLNQPEVAAAAAFDTYAVEQGVLKGCEWADADLANEVGGSYVIFSDG